MIRERTTLVLGAGASVPYGLPAAAQLRSVILQQSAKRSAGWPQVFEELGFNSAQVVEFRDAFERSSIRSIDAFLEHRTDFILVGKTAIALGLIPFEQELNVTSAREGEWYYHLFDCLRTTDAADFKRNQLTVVTFNYDRSLEFFLHTALKNTYRLRDADAANVLSAIRIHHVYGQLGNLPWQGEGNGIVRSYGADIAASKVLAARDQIQIVTERDANSDRVVEAKQLVAGAERVFYLGFSYHNENMKRVCCMRPTRGTCKGLLAAEQGEIRKRWHVTLEDVDCITFLRQCVRLGSRA
jgi:hypothetical protein